jgi:hypothetical protein
MNLIMILEWKLFVHGGIDMVKRSRLSRLLHRRKKRKMDKDYDAFEAMSAQPEPMIRI